MGRPLGVISDHLGRPDRLRNLSKTSGRGGGITLPERKSGFGGGQDNVVGPPTPRELVEFTR
eukprot:2566396-Pyramimonas_sp.AAC.1